MSTEFINDQWRLPNAWNGSESNVNKQSNYSMDFDGSSQLVDLGRPSSLNLMPSVDEFSISAWFKTSAQGTIYSFGAPSSNSNTQIKIAIRGGDYLPEVVLKGTATTIGSTTYNDGNWHNIILTCTTSTANLYIDGSNVGNPTIGTATITSTDNGAIGARTAPTGGFFFNGQIDGVAIYNYALSSSQITTLYGSSSTGIGNPQSITPNPVAWYNLGDQDAFNGAEYLTPNASLKDFVFSFSSSQEINCGNDSTVQLGTVFTMACWINTTSTSRGSIFGTYISNGYYIDLMASGTVQGGYHSTGSHFLRPSSSTVNDGKWHHVCYVISGTATDGSDLDVYVDGQLNNGSFTSSGTPSGAATTNPFKINLSGYAGRYTGKTSNVQIFNSALSSTDVETLYNNGSPLTSMSGFTSLQGWWKLDASDTYDSSTGNWTIEDSSSNSNDGTSSGMTQANLVQSDLSFTSGYSPYALDFDGTNDYIDCGSPSTLDFERTDAFSISAWVKRVGSGSYQSIVYKANNNSPYNGYALYIDNNNKVGFNITINYNSSNYFGKVCTSVLNTDWNNVLITYNGNSNVSGLNIYINGSLQTVTTIGTSSDLTGTLSNSIPFNIGARNNADVFLDGSLSNISIWNTALTSSQVTEIYSEGIPQNLNNHSAYSNLVSWWQLGSNSSFNTNWTVLDEKGSNNGTSVNMTEDDIVDGVGSYANGVSSGMSDNIVGDAFGSSANSLSYNMDVLDRTEDTPA